MSATTEMQELAVLIKGEIVNSNFDSFKAMALEKIEGMNYELLTDDDFDKAAEDVKTLKGFEKSLDIAQDEMLKQLDDVYALMEGVKEIKKASSETRLAKDREIKKRKAEKKQEILQEAYEAIIATNKDVVHRQELENAVKGKRKFAAMHTAAQAYVQKLNDSVSACREVINAHVEEYGKQLVPDVATLELGDAKHLETELALRVERAKAEEERKQREKEEAERLAKEKAEREAEELRLKAEADAKCAVSSEQCVVQQDETKKPEASEHPRNYFDKLGQQEAAPTVDGVEADKRKELQEFVNTVIGAFGAVKEARMNLKYPDNVDRAADFAAGCQAIFEGLKGGLE